MIIKNPVINFSWCLSFFDKRGKQLFGKKFKIYETDHNILYKLIIYFIGHEEEAKRLDLDLQKGILLTGPIGCGKTSLMTLMRFIPLPGNVHIMKPCRDISFEFIQEGYEVINRYSKLSYSGTGTRTFCFDDLGAEQNLKYYGNECNVMGEILQSRYDYFKSDGMITHLTTNLSASEIESFYGSRERSRLREMCNMISFGKNDADKRR